MTDPAFMAASDPDMGIPAEPMPRIARGARDDAGAKTVVAFVVTASSPPALRRRHLHRRRCTDNDLDAGSVVLMRNRLSTPC